MDKGIDCFLVGHNSMAFADYEKNIRGLGINSGAYRDLSKSFLQMDNNVYDITQIVNLFCLPGDSSKFDMLETFTPAIAYLGTYLNRRGFSFDYVNSFQAEKEEFASKLRQENILTIAIITTLYVSAYPILKIMKFIKKYNRTARVIIGGPFVSTKVYTFDQKSLDYLFKSIDADFYVNSSQGEATLVKIIHSLKNNLPMEHINNIYFKKDGSYVATPLLEEKNKLSENMANWDLFADRVGEYASVRTSISCPFSCAFCGYPEHAGKYQTTPIKKVEEELNLLNKITSLQSVHFIDDTFNIPKKRFKEFLKMLLKNNYRFRWHSYYRCQFADEEELKMMKESGCDGVFIGVEAGDDTILKNMNKKVTIKKYLRGIELLNKYHILTYGNFITGFPGETTETFRNTMNFIENSGLDYFRSQLWYCEPITPIWSEREKYDIKGNSFEWSHKTMDSETAAELVNEMYLSVKNPVWVPQYNFDFDNLLHLMYRGISLKRINRFLAIFNDGIKEKLKYPSRKNVSSHIMKRFEEFSRGIDLADGPGKVEKDGIDKLDAEFDF